MSKHLERDLGSLENEILAMSGLVEVMIGKAWRSLREKRSDLALEVIHLDSDVDAREVRIEENCLRVLALHQPVAIDLRRSAAILKINNDLERVADLAVNIAERAEYLSLNDSVPVPDALNRMAEMASGMVGDALDAMVNLSPKAARAVCAHDDRVDSDYEEVANELLRLMQSNPAFIESCLALLSVAQNVERIADHATNIAEDVVYLVEGDIARHQHERLDVESRGQPSAHSSTRI